VARDDWIRRRWELTCSDVQVCAADPTRTDLDQNLTRSSLGVRHLSDSDLAGFVDDDSTHGDLQLLICATCSSDVIYRHIYGVARPAVNRSRCGRGTVTVRDHEI
jgi:hypothetical protein